MFDFPGSTAKIPPIRNFTPLYMPVAYFTQHLGVFFLSPAPGPAARQTARHLIKVI